MKITIDWLKKYVDFSNSPEELADRLTMLGLEVEGLYKIKYEFEKVIIGEIKSVTKHIERPDLSICEVDIGDQTLKLICGAPNVISGIKVPVALPGAKFPDGRILKSETIHGVESPGMICSEAELGLSHQSDIIMVLNNQAKLGQDLITYLGEPETVIEINVTPNRPDCLSIIGVAREIAAINNSKVRKPEINLKESEDLDVNSVIQVEIKNPESCPRYTARYIEGIKVGPSPRWLIEKLEAVGLRTINNVVDATNFVMMETGQPLHAFDYDLLEEHKIIVKHAEQGERFVTLDGQEHILSNERLMICDGNKSIALAGVMGGLNSEISNHTTRVLLESALFDPVNIRRTSKALDISSDSSKRFERGVDSEGLIFALNRAAQLIQELAGGKIAKGYIDCYPIKKDKRQVNLSVNRVNKILGTSLTKNEIIDLLNRLEFQTSELDGKIIVNVPTFRVDIEREIDLIEEISRLYGFDKIESRAYSYVPLNLKINKQEKFNQKVRDFIIRMGYNEILTHSLINYELAKLFSSNIPIKLKNPINEEMGTLRTSIIPGALQIIKWNKNRKIRNQKLFEVGNIFFYDSKEQTSHKELCKIALFRTGNNRVDSWLEKSRSVSFFDLKGDIFTLLHKLDIDDIKISHSDRSFLNADRSIDIYIGKEYLGFVGDLSKDILSRLDIEDDIYLAEIDFDVLYRHFNWEKKAKPLSKFPAIKRDLAIVVDQLTPAEKVEGIIRESGGKFLRKLYLFDVYRGKQIPVDKKSFAFTLIFQSEERTLTEDEVDADIQRILQSLEQKLDARLRA